MGARVGDEEVGWDPAPVQRGLRGTFPVGTHSSYYTRRRLLVAKKRGSVVVEENEDHGVVRGYC